MKPRSVDDEVVGQIGPGLLVLAAVQRRDVAADIAWTAAKLTSLRILPSADGTKNYDRDVREIGGAVLLVSNFTVEQLSNWYVRRNRRRFWKGEAGLDKTAAYQTLFECLVAITKMMAPLAPFLSDEVYRALMSETQREPFESVHIAPMFEPKKELIDSEMERRMDVAQRVVGIVRTMRAKTNLETRQPLARIAVPASAGSFIVETVLARLVLKERIGTRRLAGTLLVLCGVILVAR